jgi:diketogulonate reductase-like aldo/keto reductase
MNNATSLVKNIIPTYGLGCYKAFGDEIINAVNWAIEAGYRYLDSASKYGNEEDIGIGLTKTTVRRDEMFILSKVWPDDYDNLERAAMKTMKDLRVDYLDCYMLHWPTNNVQRRWKAYEQLLKLEEKGICRLAAVSNFMPSQIEEIKRLFGNYPPYDEIEIHPCFQQKNTTEFLKQKKIKIIAYCPTGRGIYLKNEMINRIAVRHDKTPTQVVLRWHIQKGFIPIPKSSHLGRIKENQDIFDFILTTEEMRAIDSMECGLRKSNDPMTYNG